MKHIFLAELRKVEAKKLVTNDVEVTITFNTSDTDILDLGKIPADTLLRVYVQDARDPVLHIPVKTQAKTVKSEPDTASIQAGEEGGV